MRHKLWLTGLLLAPLAGCMVGPDYQRPDIDDPQTFLYQPKDVQQTVDTQWWKAFGDPVLDQLIGDALANNRDVKIASANVLSASGVLTSTRAPLFPQLGYEGDASRQRLPDGGLGGSAVPIKNPYSSYQAFAGASWEIDLWGRVRRLSESAQAELLASEEARRGVILSLVANVASEYIALRGLDEQLALSERSLKNYAESLHLMELQFQYGRVSEMNVEQARSRYETVAAQIPQIRQQIVEREAVLSLLLGRNPGPIPRGKSLTELQLPAVPAGLPSELLTRRPDILQAEQQLIAANALIGAAKAQYFPTISLTAATGSASSELNDLFQGSSHTWNYAGSVTGPIFTAGAISGQVTQAEAGQQAALQGYLQTVQNAFADVDTALSARDQVNQQVDAQGRLVAALQNYAKLAQALYDGGRVPYSTVLQAENDLYPAQLEYATDQSLKLIALVSIYKAMGGGWVDQAAEQAGVASTASR